MTEQSVAIPTRWSRWLDRLTQLIDRPSPLVKQSPTLFVLVLGIVLVWATPALDFLEIPEAVAGIIVVGFATTLALVLTLRGIDDGWLVLLIPMLDIIGLGLFRAGTGGPSSMFGGFVLIPVVWLASAPGRRWIFIVVGLTAVTQILPYLRMPPTNWEEWLRGVVTPLVLGIVAAIVNELSRLQRSRTELAEQLAADREVALRATTEALDRLQESEKAYRELLSLFESVWNATTDQAVIGTDLDGRVIAWNPGAVRFFGRSSADVVGELRVDQLLPRDGLALPADGTPAEPEEGGLAQGVRWAFAQADEGEPVDYDLELIGASGALIPMRVTVTARHDELGARLGYLVVLTDETRAAEVARLKDEFVGMISHELRTPLSSILGYLELLEHDAAHPLEAEQREFLSIIGRNANRLLKLVSDLLFTAQVESGQFPLESREADIVAVVEASIESARPAAEHAGIELIAELPESAVALRFDPTRIGQAVDNLVSNAIKFTPRGGRVVVTLTVGSATVSLSVRDTGIGIQDDEVGRLFTRFFRASTATRNAVPGVGLGLTITKAIITAHGGWMDVTSKLGAGTEFKFFLPR